MPEQWLPVVGSEGFYEVSHQGRVRSLDREFIRADGRRQVRRGRLLIPTSSGRGYLSVQLRLGRRATVHVLVCTAFHGPRPFDGAEVAHWNGDKLDNRSSNLRWATRAENSADSTRHGTSPLVRGGVGEANGHARLSWQDVEEMRSRWDAGGTTQAALAEAYGIGKSQVHNIVRRKRWMTREEWKP